MLDTTVNQYTEGITFASRVVSGEIPANRYLIKGCQRFLNYLEKKDWKWEFNPKQAQHILSFINLLKLSKGPDAGKQFVLQPFQVYLLCAVFGFTDKANPWIRMVRNASLFAPRKCGKSELGAALALYFLWFGEQGTQVFSIARDRNQASLILSTAMVFVRNAPSFLANEYTVRAFDITCSRTGGYYKALSKEASKGSGDGLNPELVLADEASQLPRELIEVMESGMVARASPLMFSLTTASAVLVSKFRENLEYQKNILDEVAADDPSFFAMIYELDASMDWKDPKTWPIVNPMFGVSVFPEAIEQRVKEAQSKPSMINEVLTKSFNLFVSSESAWLDLRHWEQSPKGPPAQEPEASYITFDLSLTRDLCCVCVLDRYSDEQFFVKLMFFLPEDSMELVPLHDQSIFRDAITRGTLKLTQGNVSDYQEIENFIMQVVNKKTIKMIGYDPWNSNALVARLYERGLPLRKIGQGMASLSAATKQTEKLIYQHAISHEHDPMMIYQLNNVAIYQDVNNNVKVRKPEANNAAKIDGVVSMIMGIHLHLEDPIFCLPRVLII